MASQKLTAEILTAAIEGFEAQKRRIDEQIAAIRQLQAGAPASTSASETPTRKRTMSAAARRRIGAAQRKRWADARKQSGQPAQAKRSGPKRKLSAAGRKAIVDAAKRRWALKRAEAQGAKPTEAGKTTASKAAPRKRAAKKAAG